MPEKIATIFNFLRLRVWDEKRVVQELREHGLNKKEIGMLLLENRKLDPGIVYSNKFLHAPQDLEIMALRIRAERKFKKEKGGENVLAAK